MEKRFGLCEPCMAVRKFNLTPLKDQMYLISEDNLYAVSHHAPKAKQIKCGHCSTLKSSEWGFTPVRITGPECLAKGIRSHLDALKATSWSFGHASLMELADWLEREAKHIAHHGKDYWIDAGVLYFFGLGDGFVITLNQEEISLSTLVALFLK